MVSAGHPPALLVTAVGETTYLEGERCVPIGITRDPECHEITCVVEPGSMVVMYTDGLVERRRQPIDLGLDALRAAVCEHNGDPDTLCDLILERLGVADADDDVAVLVMQPVSLKGSTLALHRPALPATVAGCRRVLERWLTANDIEGEVAGDVLLATTEAITNSVRHAYRHPEGSVDVQAEFERGQLLVTIRDRGAWRTAARPTMSAVGASG